MDQEDATNIFIQWLRNPNHGGYARYGYDIYVPHLLYQYLEREERLQRTDLDRRVHELMPAFFAAGWDLCRRGIIRPGVREYNAQATDQGNAGCGYSITPFGIQWLAESDSDTYVPTEPGRFARMLSIYRDRFGEGFQERGQEAVRCYGAHAYLACCTMSGAAAESILLTMAIAKQDEATVLRAYMSAGGRRRVENIVIGRVRDQLRSEYHGYMSLLKYWRDNAAHGQASGVSDNEAFTSIALLLRFAAFANDNWAEFMAA